MHTKQHAKYLVLSATFLVIALSSPFWVFAQQATSTQQSVDEREQQLQSELDSINQEISGLNNTISGLQTQKSGLDRDIKLLTATIDKANLNIKAKTIQINQLSSGIADKSQTIDDLQAKIDRERQSLAQIIRKSSELSDSSMLEIVLSNGTLSDFFSDLDSFDALQESLRNSTEAIKSAKQETETAKADLEDRQAKEEDAKAELERNKQIVVSNQKEKNQLLAITKNKEKEYQKVLNDRKKRAAEIRAALFALRDSTEIPFGQALDYANFVRDKTGIRPAFLLAVFMQESSLGKNQGSCLLKDKTTGSGVSIKSGDAISKVMKPDRDVPPFLQITSAVGRDWQNTRVSCPQDVGWGGAMGPAQFIPSTWVLYDDLITRATGNTVADPWNPQDAFLAAAFLLKDNGASSGGYSAERDAACKYFSGRSCSQSSWAATYGTQVMQKAANIQTTMIDPLQNT